ncbi:hypothetical protein [Roseomonas sp. SXEYE001]|nr:hypothetical protein [Roseomonas sp. SXEYE001]MCV4207532.1 hypothetical protein [Roseomonas sp. SXEYE001]
MLAALGVRRVTTYHLLDPAGDATDAERILAALNRTDRRALLWLAIDGAPRKRGDKKEGEWRPLLADLRRLRALRLVEESPEGWGATAAGIAARVALVAALEKKGGADA